jgi:polysaccharide export outer membrane protein
LPSAAPTIESIQDEAKGGARFFLVNVDPDIEQELRQPHVEALPASFQSFSYVPNLVIRPGDTVAITIFGAGHNELFGASVPNSSSSSTSASATAGTTLPVQIVDNDGKIMVPFVGQVMAAGELPAELGRSISNRLANQIFSPQVLVNVTSASNFASVNGEVNRAGPIALTLRGERILDAIAAAGGTRFPDNEMDVQIVRDSMAVTTALDQIVKNPTDNIPVKPGDQILLMHRPRTYLVLGAAQKVAQYNFDTPNVTVAEAVARAGGPIDLQGTLSGVYLLREEQADRARNLLSGLLNEPESAEALRALAEENRTPVSVIFHFDMSTVAGLFYAKDIPIQDKDVLIIANAGDTQLLKALGVLRGFTGTIFDLTARFR